MGRLVAVIALTIATLVAPALSSLDQVFQYIQMVTGFVYPGAAVVYGLGLFRKQVTNKAALWTAIVTLPLGVVFYMVTPEVPFILRMGYVFMILCVIASVISFIDRGAKVSVPSPTGSSQARLVATSYVLLGIGVICILAGIFLSSPLAALGFEAIFVFGTIFLMLGIVVFTNAKMDVQDKKAIELNPALFQTDVVFNVGAVGIVAIVTILYSIFWM